MRQLKQALALVLCLAALISAAAAFDDPIPCSSVAAPARVTELHNRDAAAAPRTLSAQSAPGVRRIRCRIALRCGEGALFLCVLLSLLCRRAAQPAALDAQTLHCCVGHPHHAPPCARFRCVQFN